MKNSIIRLTYGLIIVFFIACTSDPVDAPLGEFETGVLIMNEGAFGVNDGEVFHYNPTSGVIKADVFQSKNQRPFGGLIQDMVYTESRLYLVANTGKVEVVDPKGFGSIGALSIGLTNSRSLVVAANKLFISDWGSYDANFNNPDSFIAVSNSLDGGPIVDKITVSSRPEGMAVVENTILVACSAAKTIDFISINSQKVTLSYTVTGTPHGFLTMGESLYLYATGDDFANFYEIDKNNFALKRVLSFPLSDPTSKFALGEGSEVYIITSTGWPDYQDAVAKISLDTKEVLNEALYIGSGFYGIGFKIDTKEIYVAENNSFQGNGSVSILSDSGQKIKTLKVGKGPSGFVFK